MGERHTDGPWHVVEGGICAVNCPPDGSNVICCEPERVMAASLAKWPDNASLLAAAPDLLTVVERQKALLDMAGGAIWAWSREASTIGRTAHLADVLVAILNGDKARDLTTLTDAALLKARGGEG